MISIASTRCAAFASLLLPAFCLAGSQGVRFNSPGVIDLARHEALAHGKALPPTELAASAAHQILAAPAWDQDKATLPFSDYAFGCAADSKTCVAEHEQKLISASAGSAQRIKQRLSIKAADAPALVFVDWIEPTTKTADGDEEKHWYLGTLPKNGYHQVEVQFGHDAPGSFLINPRSGKAAFVHSGSDIAAVSPDGAHLVTFNADNPPLTLRVAALDASGPRVELECVARDDDRATAQFKGWHDDGSFDFVLMRAGEPTPARISHIASTWSLAVDAARLHGFGCR